MIARAPGPRRYRDPVFGCEAAKILPGEFLVAGEGLALVTVLGSCVSACVRDRESGLGGMNHFLLPEGGDGPAGASARYGVNAMEIMLNELMKRGARREVLEAKVFGGASVLPGLASAQVGERNAEFVLRFLETESIPVVGRDLLGSWPRKVYWFPRTGRAAVRKLKGKASGPLARREGAYRERISVAPVGGDLELFT
jgi:chemotaxis protein CheD